MIARCYNGGSRDCRLTRLGSELRFPLIKCSLCFGFNGGTLWNYKESRDRHANPRLITRELCSIWGKERQKGDNTMICSRKLRKFDIQSPRQKIVDRITRKGDRENYHGYQPISAEQISPIEQFEGVSRSDIHVSLETNEEPLAWRTG